METKVFDESLAVYRKFASAKVIPNARETNQRLLEKTIQEHMNELAPDHDQQEIQLKLFNLYQILLFPITSKRIRKGDIVVSRNFGEWNNYENKPHYYKTSKDLDFFTQTHVDLIPNVEKRS